MRIALAMLVCVAGCSRESPEAAFKRIMAPKVGKIENTEFKAPSGFTYKVGTVRYDVVKTDSLITPFAAKIVFDLEEGGTESRPSHAGEFTADYAYTEDRWRYRDSNFHFLIEGVRADDGSWLIPSRPWDEPGHQIARECGLNIE
ncbi:MAG TPA: hypothetical protein VHC22_17920 [Pirellulales bacterium]|nr:hypothetical protein [Pirellulales bacterium]